MSKGCLFNTMAGGLALAIMVGCSAGARNDNAAGGKSPDSSFDKSLQQQKQWSKEAAGRAGQAALHFAGEASSAADNDQTSISVKSALLAAKDMSTDRLRVDTNGKTVTLSGTVRSTSQKQRATQIAKNVLGPGYNVHNQLTINAS